MKIKFLIAAFLIFASCNSNKKGFTIIGLTSDIPDSSKIYLANSDSTFVINNQFQFKGFVDSLKQYMIYTKGFRDSKSLWIDNSEIIIDASKSTLSNARISGSKLQNLNTQYLDIRAFWGKKIDSLRLLSRQINESDSVRLKRYLQMKDSIKIGEQNGIMTFMRSNPDFYLGSFYLTFLMFNQPKQLTQEMFNALSNITQNNKWGHSVKFYLEKSAELKIGDNAVDFILPDIGGRQISLSSFKGKYVLLEFWAQWCTGCRRENPLLLKMYRKYNTKGFEIIGVSIDEKRESWESTIKSDTLIWTTVSDLKGTLGEVPLTYMVNYLPKNYLIDPSGKIMDIDIRGPVLEDKLISIFKN